MAEPKTKPTKDSVKDFISKVADEKRRTDCQVVLDLMADVTQAKPEMWGSSIVGFGRYRYKGASGRETEGMVTGFSPRKGDLTLYLIAGIQSFPELTKVLGKHKTGKSCLYIKKLDDINLDVLRKILEKAVDRMADKRIDK